MVSSNRRTLAALVAVVLLLSAGCASRPVVPASGVEAASPAANASEDAGAARGANASASDAYRWEGGRVTVAVDADDGSRDFRPQVRAAVRFWNRHADARATAGPVTLADAADADVVVRFVDDLDRCGHERRPRVLGCAPLLKPGDLAPNPVVVRVETGYTDESTERVVTHELGHVLGVGHGADLAVMAPDQRAEQLPVPNATDRTNPWRDGELAVAVDYGDLPSGERSAYRRAVGRVVAYYNGAVERTPADVRLVRTSDPDSADVVVLVDRPACAADGVCWRHLGESVDTDPAMEYYTRHEVYVDRTGASRATYQVGVGVGMALGTTDRRALPRPVDGVDDDPNARWWA